MPNPKHQKKLVIKSEDAQLVFGEGGHAPNRPDAQGEVHDRR